MDVGTDSYASSLQSALCAAPLAATPERTDVRLLVGSLLLCPSS
uniref:Uncharacterized protein n=1 Tax=Aegilops tauschii subsp. strangulata TaxID=200361 RepID=A0A453FBR4_AEGTS